MHFRRNFCPAATRQRPAVTALGGGGKSRSERKVGGEEGRGNGKGKLEGIGGKKSKGKGRRRVER